MHLARRKESVKQFDVRTQESDVAQPFLYGLLGPGPHTCPLDVDADKVDIGIEPRQSDGVFATATAQFEYNGMVVLKILVVPMTSHDKRGFCHGLKWTLEDILKRFHIRKLGQLSFSHSFLFCCKFTHFSLTSPIFQHFFFSQLRQAAPAVAAIAWAKCHN